MSVFGETDAPASTTEPETTEARSMISLLKAIKNQNISGDAVMQSKVDDMTALLEIIAEELDTAGGIDGDRILSLPSVRNWF